MKNNEMSRQARHDATVRHDVTAWNGVTAWDDAAARHGVWTWRKGALAVLVLLFTVVLSFAVVQAVPANAATTYTDKTQENGLVIGVSDGGLWTLDNDTTPKKYTAVKNTKTTPSLKFTIEGEQYFSFEYHFTANSYATSATNYFIVDIDDVQQCQVSNTGAENTAQEYIMKTRGAGTHTVVLWANGANHSTEKKQVEMYFQNFRLRNEGEFTKHNLTMDYNEKFLATYIVEGANGGWNGNKDTEEQIKAAATYLEPGKEYPLPEGMSFCFISFSKTYVSSISGEEIRSHMLSNHIQSADGKKQITSSGGGPGVRVTGCKITNTGIRQAMNAHADTSGTSRQCEGYALKDITCEYAPQPQVSYAEYVDGGEVPHKLDWNETVTLPNGQTTLPIRIRSTFKDFDKFYKVKVNGVETEVEWERKDETTIASAITVEQRSTVLVSGWFGEQYIYQEKGATSGKLGTEYLYKGELKEGDVDQKLSFQFNIDVLTENGVKDVLADAKAENIAEVVQDEAYPWYYDAARSDEGMAFTSGLSGASAEAQKISQLGFKVKGSGVFIFEFQIDGTGDITTAKKSWAAYNLDSKVAASNWGSGTISSYLTKDFNAYFGFKSGLATSIAYGLSSDNAYNLVHRPSNPVHDEWTDPADQTKKNDKTTSNEKYWTNFEDTRKLHSTQWIATTADSEWYRVTIPIKDKQDADETMIYLAHAVYAVSSNYTAANGYSGERMTIRNVGFYPNDTSVSFAVENGEGTPSSNGTISVKADGKDITLKDGMPDDSTPLSLGARLTLTATPNEGNFFYGWQEVIGEKTRIFSYDKETSYSVMAAEVQIVALIAKEGTFAVRYGGEFYKTANVQDAFDAASTGADKTVIAVDNVTLTGALTIPAGVNFVISYNTKGGITEEGNSKNATNRVSWWEKGKYKDPVYKVTLGEGATLTVEGNFYVGGVLHYPDQSAQGHTSGAYSEFVNNGAVTVGDGGVMDVCGRVTGKGGITVRSGGKLYQPFMILDYNGGTNTQAMFENAKVTPFKMYAMVNIQCEGGYTIEYGGVLFGHASLYFFSSITKLEQPFITYDKALSDAASGLLIMKSGSKVTSIYDDRHARVNMDDPSTGDKDEDKENNVQDVGKTTMTINGDVEAGYMDFLHTVQTKDVNFALPYNYKVIIANGNFTVANHFKVMPGAEVTVDSGATVTVKSGKSLHVYDSFYGPAFAKREYPTGDQLSAAGYKTYASLIVNGKLVIENNATFVGTVQTTGTTGEININAGATLTASLHDGVVTQYGCNYTKYTLKAQVWDSAHGAMADLKAGVYHAVKTTETWTLPGIKFEYESKTSHTSGAHSLQSLTTAAATGLTGSWKVDHDGHAFDWSKLTAEEKDFMGAKFNELTRQCKEIGCTDKEHKLLLAEGFDFHATYKGAQFTVDDLREIFYQYYFGQTSVPDQYKYFSAAVASSASIQNAGDYDGVTVTLTKGYFGDVGESHTSATKSFTVDKFDVKNLDQGAIQNSLRGLVYDGNAKTPDLTLQAEDLTGAVMHETLDWKNNVNASDMGASVTVKGSGDNFTGELTINFSIAKAELSVTLVAAGHTYGETPKTPDITLVGVQNNEETQIKNAITRTPIATQWSDVGDYGVTWEYNGETGVLANYEISFTNQDAEIYKVTAKDITEAATATAAGATYNGKAQEAAFTFVFEGHEEYLAYFEKTTDYTVSYAKDGEISPVNAGTYTVTIAGTGNYSGSITCEYVISPKAVKVTVNPQKYTYDREAHSYNANAQDAWTAEGLENNEDKGVLNVTITGSGTDAATYPVQCGYTNGNYTVTFEGQASALVIEAAEIGSVEVTSSHTYNGDTQTPTLTVQAGEIILDGGEYTASYDKTVKNADTYTVTVKANSKNFKNGAEDVTATFTIAKKAITVTADNITGTYGDEKPEPTDFTVESGALVGGDQQSVLNVTLTLEAVEKDQYVVGKSYQITGEGTADNYDITVTPGKYTVGKKAITVKADDIVGTYGEEAPTAFTFTVPEGALEYGDLKDVLRVTLTLASAAKYVVGTSYAITGEGTADNYTVTVTAGKYTVKAKEITVTILEQKVTYNAAKQSPTSNYNMDWTVTGLVSGDTYGDLGVTLSATGDCLNVGSYDITGTATAANYSVKFSDGTEKFVIEKKGITVTATSLNLPEGTTQESVESQLAFTVDGLYEDNNDVKEHIVVSVEYDESAKQGKTFDITVAFKDGYEPQNYKVDKFVKGVLSIIDSKFKDVVFEGNSFVYDGTLHTLTATGLPEGAVAAYAYAQGDSALESEGVKNAGSYTVTLTVTLEGYQDYTKSVQLTITQKAIVITADDVNKVYGEELVDNTALTFTVPADALAEGDSKEVLTVSLSWGRNREVGNHPITGTATAENYTVTVTAGTYHITAKPITVTILKQTWATYNTSEQFVRSTVNDWDVADDALAWNDSKETLNVTLTGSGTDAGSYDIEGKSANGNYKVTFEGGEDAFVIAKMDIKDAKIAVLGGTFTYNEKQQTPDITVTLTGFGTLVITKEYTVAYGNNTTVKEGGEITITGEGNFTGTAQTTFEILPMSIAGLEITLDAPEKVIYDGTQQQPEFSVALDGFTKVDLLAAEYGKNIDAGENAGSLTVKGTENFTGTVTKNFTIHARPVTVTVQKQTVTYNQKLQKASSAETYWDVTDLAAKDKASDLHITLTAEGTEAGAYDIVCAWTNGNYAVTFKGDGLTAEGATVKEAFVIGAAALTEANLTSKHTYNGTAHTPTFAVKAGGLNVADGDFELVFADDADRVSAGTVQVTVKAASKNYSGELAKSFEIAQKQVKATLQPQSFVYSGEIPTPNHKAYTVEEGGLCSRDGVQDDLKVTISIVDGQKDVHTYTLTAVAGNGDYSVTFENSTLTITQKEITVKADDITSVYGSPIEKLTYTAEGLVAGEDPAEVLKVTLQTGTIKDEGQYEITGSGSAANYTFTVEKGTYTVLPKQITVTIVDKSSVYDGKEPAITSVQGTDWTVEKGAIEEGDDLRIKLTKAAGVTVTEGGYAITGEFTNHNYTVEWVNGTYTIEAREVTVEILDQRATYDYHETKEYAFDGTKWQVDAETLAPDEEKSVLGVTLTKPNLSDANAGAYEITGKWNNTNYAVSFAGSFEGRGGTYTIDKLDISDDAVFILGRKDGGVEEKDGSLWMRFAGKALELTGDVTFFTDKDKISFAKTDSIKINPAALEKVGNYQVTVSIEDANFMGSAVFEVVVTNENGYTERLEQTLARLRELKAGLTKETLQAKDFAALKEMSTLIAALDEEELNVASEELAEYETLMEYWNDAADIGTAIETAEKIGDAPIEALFGAVAALTALCGLAYIAMKGGML